MHGISTRWSQDKIRYALVAHLDAASVNLFMKKVSEDIVKSEVQGAIAADENALMRLWESYLKM